MTLATATPTGPGQVLASPGFETWLAENQLALALSNLEGGAVMVLGLEPSGALFTCEAAVPRPSALHAHGENLWLAAEHHVARYVWGPPPSSMTGVREPVYFPRSRFYSPHLAATDVDFDAQGTPIFLSARYNDLVTLDDHRLVRYGTTSAASEWSWSSNTGQRLLSCGLREGLPAMLGVAQGEGCHLFDPLEKRQVLGGLLWPIGMRFHAKPLGSGVAWFVDAGSGQLGYLDPQRAEFVEVAFCAGWAQCLALAAGYAIVGLAPVPSVHSPLIAHRESPQLPRAVVRLRAALEQHDAVARSGVAIVRLDTGVTEHWIRWDCRAGGVSGVATLPHAVRPFLAEPN